MAMFTPQLLVQVLAALLSSAAVPVPHPHYSKAIVMPGAGGKVTFTYFTVPYNAEHLKELKDGFVFGRGTVGMQSEVPLTIGGKTFPAGNYALTPVCGKTKDEWSLRIGAPRGRGRQAAEATEPVDVQMKSTKADHDEHLAVAVISNGFATARRGSTEPTGGVTGQIRIGFGDLHQIVALEEVFPAPDKKK
jgi:hypothetical protein